MITERKRTVPYLALCRSLFENPELWKDWTFRIFRVSLALLFVLSPLLLPFEVKGIREWIPALTIDSTSLVAGPELIRCSAFRAVKAVRFLTDVLCGA